MLCFRCLCLCRSCELGLRVTSGQNIMSEQGQLIQRNVMIRHKPSFGRKTQRNKKIIIFCYEFHAIIDALIFSHAIGVVWHTICSRFSGECCKTSFTLLLVNHLITYIKMTIVRKKLKSLK